MKLTIYTDGAARGNPGPAGIGILIKQADKIIAEISDYIGETTNNIAEYSAFIRGLEEAAKLKAKEVSVFCDSELLVKQIKGEYRVKNQGLRPLFARAKALLDNFDKFSLKHIPREQNKEADALANRGIDQV
ncbi:MAG: ribonuclease HI family protein [bacterium]